MARAVLVDGQIAETTRGTAAREIPRIVRTKIGLVVEPVGIFAGLASLGVLLGVIPLFLAYRKASRSSVAGTFRSAYSNTSVP